MGLLDNLFGTANTGKSVRTTIDAVVLLALPAWLWVEMPRRMAAKFRIQIHLHSLSNSPSA